MSENISVINLTEVVDFLNGLTESTFEIAKTEIATALFNADNSIKNDTELMTRTGNLFQSIQTRVEGNGFSSLQASIYTTSVYAPTHEYGATIRAIDKYMGVPGGPYLNIPTSSNKTAAGVTRKTATQVFSVGGHVVKFKSGKYGVMLNGQVMYTLHKSVEIPARLGMFDKTEAEVPTLLSNIASQIGEI